MSTTGPFPKTGPLVDANWGPVPCFALNWAIDSSPFRGAASKLVQWIFGVVFAGFLVTCHSEVAEDSIVITQTPDQIKEFDKLNIDHDYPAGTRVVCVRPPFKPGDARLLSSGLIAAGSPTVSPEGRRVFFAGKANAGDTWQIYETPSSGGRPKPATSMPGGAADPAVLGNGDLLFSSPPAKFGETWKPGNPAALYRQAPGGSPQRLTYGVKPAIEPTVLRDGTLLFVSARSSSESAEAPRLGLFTINDDGTEITAFAVDNDGAPWIRRPRELLDGRVGFLSSTGARVSGFLCEAIRSARPFASRGPLFSIPTGLCRSVEPDGRGAFLVCMETRGLMGRSMARSYAIFRIAPDARELGSPIYHDPAWNEVEAVPVVERRKPMGHVSAIKPALKFGTILCLNANFTRPGATNGMAAGKAVRVRVLANSDQSKEIVLGDIALQADGSFMATVPAETALGFEALDDQDRVIRRLPPSIWLRPGENRSCLGCHEPYNRSPRNVRPIAAGLPPVALGGKTSALSP